MFKLYLLVVASLRNYFQRKLDAAVQESLPWIAQEYGDDLERLRFQQAVRGFYTDAASQGRPLTPEAVIERLRFSVTDIHHETAS